MVGHYVGTQFEKVEEIAVGHHIGTQESVANLNVTNFDSIWFTINYFVSVRGLLFTNLNEFICNYK